MMHVHGYLHRLCLAAITVLTFACHSTTDNKSTRTSSSSFAELAQRQAFLEKYVTFRRHYQELEFNIFFQDNSHGLVPGPSDWYIEIVAKVPVEEIQAWTQNLTPTSPPSSQDLNALRQHYTLPLSGVVKWLQQPGVTVGVDSEHGIVYYHNTSYSH